MISLRDVVTGFGARDPLAEVWRHNLRGGGGGAAEITGVPPLRYIGDGRPLTDYRIAGNTLQDGTPSAEAPVDAAGSGVWDEAQQSFKLPLTVNGVEYPIYLGQVETTRRIKKLVLTGEEYWQLWNGNYYSSVIDRKGATSTILCTHFINISGGITYSINSSSGLKIASGAVPFVSSVDDLKEWLAAQYAAGTPVTVWYVLATEETAVVNEPLMKIGDYADTVSFAQAGVTIPTVNGANVLDMASSVKPSEVYIKGKGIKPTGYGQLVDKNSVRILDKNDVRILVHGQ